MGHPLAGSCEAHNMIKSIAHDQPQKNFKYLWLVFCSSPRRCTPRDRKISMRGKSFLTTSGQPPVAETILRPGTLRAISKGIFRVNRVSISLINQGPAV